MAFYVIDGPDGCGKTTLAQALQKETKGSVFAWHKDSSYRQYATNLLQITDPALPREYTIIWDRCFIDERVYQPVMRPGEESRLFTEHEYQVLCHLLNIACPTFIFCDTIIREEDPYVSPEQNREVLRGFKKILCERMFDNIRILNYNASQWRPEEFVRYIAHD